MLLLNLLFIFYIFMLCRVGSVLMTLSVTVERQGDGQMYFEKYSIIVIFVSFKINALETFSLNTVWRLNGVRVGKYYNLFSAFLQCYDLIPGKKMFNVNFNTCSNPRSSIDIPLR
jgi:hypothetical protein